MQYGWILEILAIGLLGIVVFQDFRQRAISWLLIPGLLVLFAAMAISANNLNDAAFNGLINLAFVAIQLICLTAWFSLKNRKFTNIVNSYLGIGDILFFCVLCLAFSPVNFIFFYLGSLILTIIGFVSYSGLRKESNKEIPLAGAMALGLIACFIYKYLHPGCSFYTEAFVI